MYQLISAIGKPLNGDGRWKSIAIGNVAISVLFSTYSRIIATLSNQFLTAPVALDLVTIRPEFGGESITFNAFLIQNGNATLETLAKPPVLNPRYAKYADAFHVGYKVAPMHLGSAPDAQYTLAEKTSLHLTRPDTDYSLFQQSCLVNVNGFFHLVDTDTHGIYVKDGMRSAFQSGQNQLGILSFRNIGVLKTIPIKPAMVYKQNDRQFYKDRCFVNLGIDVSNKTVLLVLGGYLHVLDRKTFFRVSNSAFCIDIGNYPLLDHFYESKRYLDFTSLALETTTRNSEQIDIDNFYSDAAILAYLTLSQSFFVVIDNPNVFVNKVPVHKTKLPNMFISHVKPEYPLIVGAGKLGNYWYSAEDGQYSLTCVDSLRKHRLYDTVDAAKQYSVSDSCVPGNPVVQSDAFFLEIGCDI